MNKIWWQGDYREKLILLPTFILSQTKLDTTQQKVKRIMKYNNVMKYNKEIRRFSWLGFMAYQPL